MWGILKHVDPCVSPSFSLKNRLARLAWNIVYILLFRFSPTPLHAWRAFLLCCSGAKLGRCCHVYPKAKIWAPWNLEIDDYATIADDVICYSMARIRLGKRVVVSQGVRLITGTHDYEGPQFQLVANPIEVGDYAWIAQEAFILPGVNIGEGAVIGARAVVTKDVPAWNVCAGNPCRFIKQRVIKR